MILPRPSGTGGVAGFTDAASKVWEYDKHPVNATKLIRIVDVSIFAPCAVSLSHSTL
ncbi:MAG TPA: hypothetical protein VNY05_31575 [Candidatus Acidoferrales bacterium]|nr:hypothetical protein [Candidatus Acidoferrales bacterium]